MKIRIKGNALRYRLTRSDIAQLTKVGFLEDKIDFGEQSLLYALQLTDSGSLSATFVNNTITLNMPENMINEWENADKVGFEHTAGDLHLLVEKDFTCLDKVDEDQSDNYPNPLAGKFQG
ncbi:MAG TPA: hypothetical protein VNW95_01310 [Mucilaginibacter sp.]|jgi:hypothetical protein|nr:hypothetical protein [Mucilaginibacter sp.]